MDRSRRIVPLAQVPQEWQELASYCISCSSTRRVRAVVAVEVDEAWMIKSYYGICGYHAEVYQETPAAHQGEA